MKYEAVIGLEVHAQLLTKSKMFCGCSADYAAAPPNTHVCAICLGMPGVLPVINRRAVDYVIMSGLALNCQVPTYSIFARKNYHYPDLMKGYQISQYEQPLCQNGWLDIEVQGQPKRIGIDRVHLEEDTAKLFHVGDASLIDVNRSGVPLMEIVTRPDMRSGEEARQYLIKLQQILRYLGVCTGNMEEGAMRCEPSVSIRPAGSDSWGTKVEIKNLNSFRSVKQALDFEIQRQIDLLETGERVQQVTMGWDEDRNVTVLQRSKEEAHDYRYFPEPDLPSLIVDTPWVESIKSQLVELPAERQERFVREFGLNPKDAAMLVAEREVAEFYERCVHTCGDPITVLYWITGELFRLQKVSEKSITEVKITPESLADLMTLVRENTINLNTAKRVFELMFEGGGSPRQIVAEKGLAQISDDEALRQIVEEVIHAQPEAVQQVRNGRQQVLGFLVGQVMRATQGKANPQIVQSLLLEAIGHE